MLNEQKAKLNQAAESATKQAEDKRVDFMRKYLSTWNRPIERFFSLSHLVPLLSDCTFLSRVKQKLY